MKVKKCAFTGHRPQAVGVTTSRIGQIAHKAARDIRQEVLRRGVRIKREKDRKCGLCCLSSEATKTSRPTM